MKRIDKGSFMSAVNTILFLADLKTPMLKRTKSTKQTYLLYMLLDSINYYYIVHTEL